MRKFLLSSLAIVMVCLALTPDAAHGEEDIWARGGDYFIRLEPQDTLRNQTPPRNNHPQILPAESIRSALSLVYYAPASDDEATPLFTDRTLDLLSTAIHKGLRDASGSQDITFVVETWHELFLGLSEALAVGGRVFYLDDSLHFIVGTLRSPNRRSLSEAEHKVLNKDKRLNPYRIGYRDKRIRHQGILSAEANSGVYAASNNRRDWLVFTPEALGMTETPTAQKKRKRKEDNNDVADALGKDVPPEVMATINKRLEALKILREGGLISDEDFREKKRAILRDL